jgi:phage protein U
MTEKKPFEHPNPTDKRPETGAIWIGSTDDDTTVKAQYNPKELQIDRNVPWQKKNQANQANPTGLHLEFTGAEGRTMSVELLFDEYETGASGKVVQAIKDLNWMASVLNSTSTKEDQRRPHLCLATWGTTVKGFKCVIESLSTKYTMFSADGAPLRATCTVKLKEADVVSKAADTPSGTASPGTASKTGK